MGIVSMYNNENETIKNALSIIKDHHGIIRTKEAINSGIHPRILYTLRNSNTITEISRGLFKLSSIKNISNPELITIALKYPNAVICLISALAYYNLTTQIPNSISIAVKKGSDTPALNYPPISTHRFSDESYNEGIQKHKVDGIEVKFYSPEKTIADCFKFRHKIGIDAAIEALKLYQNKYKLDLNKIMRYAKICRVKNIIKPYIEAII